MDSILFNIKIEVLTKMLEGEIYIRAARYGGQIYWYDDTVDKFVAQYDGESPRFTDINSLSNQVEYAGFADYDDVVKYATSDNNQGI